MDADTTMTTTQLVRDYAWLAILAVMLVIVIFRFASGAIRWERKDKGEQRHSSRKDPDSLPDLTNNIRKTRIQVFLAGLIVVLTFILFAFLRTLDS